MRDTTHFAQQIETYGFALAPQAFQDDPDLAIISDFALRAFTGEDPSLPSFQPVVRLVEDFDTEQPEERSWRLSMSNARTASRFPEVLAANRLAHSMVRVVDQRSWEEQFPLINVYIQAYRPGDFIGSHIDYNPETRSDIHMLALDAGRVTTFHALNGMRITRHSQYGDWITTPSSPMVDNIRTDLPVHHARSNGLEPASFVLLAFRSRSCGLSAEDFATMAEAIPQTSELA